MFIFIGMLFAGWDYRNHQSNMQTRKQSLLESITNIVIGYVVALFSQFIIFPLLGYDIPIKDNMLIGLWFTGVSIIRSYCLRRFFNKYSKLFCIFKTNV